VALFYNKSSFAIGGPFTILSFTIRHNASQKIKPHKTYSFHHHQSKSTMKLNLFLLSAAAMVNAAIGDTDTVDLRTAGNYAILASAGISTVPTSAITGNIAVSPISAGAITGFSLTSPGTDSTSDQVTGTVYAADYIAPTPSILSIAVGDMEIAYTDAAGRPNNDAVRKNVPDFGSQPLTPGVYTFSTGVTIGTDITFDAGGNEDAVFIIQIAQEFVQVAGTSVILSGDAKAENIFWQVAGQVTVRAGAHLEGVLLVKTAAIFETKSTLNGRILAQTAVTLDMATITQPST
jgi:hypothetical protein